VAELRGAGDEADDGDALARRSPADTGGATYAARLRNESRPRAEYAAVLRAEVDSKAPDQQDATQEAADQKAADQEAQDSKTADQEASDPETADPDALQRFEPSRAGLPEVTHADAVSYIDEHQADRPWLAQARDCSSDAQRVIVALDQGHGHAHIRHEGWVTEEMNERRVRNLEDPAQLNQAKREAGIDAFKADDQPHRCGGVATRITDPEAFAMAFARGIEHPDVQAALSSPLLVPRPVRLPISEVLGEDGHKFCSGWQLDPVNGSMDEARADRNAWAAGDHSGPEPRTRPVETFEGGTVVYVFRPSATGGHEVSTMYVDPPDNQST
jgi:hypothetical protein